MKLLIKILIFGLGITVTCASQSKTDSTVLSSPSEDHLVIPEGAYTGSAISKQKLEKTIAKQFDSFSKVYNISMKGQLSASEVVFTGFMYIAVLGAFVLNHQDTDYFSDLSDLFLVSFTAEDFDGAIYSGINCIGSSFIKSRIEEFGSLHIRLCENNEVKFSENLLIKMSDILVH